MAASTPPPMQNGARSPRARCGGRHVHEVSPVVRTPGPCPGSLGVSRGPCLLVPRRGVGRAAGREAPGPSRHGGGRGPTPSLDRQRERPRRRRPRESTGMATVVDRGVELRRPARSAAPWSWRAGEPGGLVTHAQLHRARRVTSVQLVGWATRTCRSATTTIGALDHLHRPGHDAGLVRPCSPGSNRGAAASSSRVRPDGAVRRSRSYAVLDTFRPHRDQPGVGVAMVPRRRRGRSCLSYSSPRLAAATRDLRSLAHLPARTAPSVRGRGERRPR